MSNLTTYQQFFTFKKIYILVYMFFGTLALFSQNAETENWYFGDFAGLNFAPTEDPNILSNSDMIAPAGCASISSISGELQFYTNGIDIWNKNHFIMDNGSGLFGYEEATQNSIIIPIADIQGQYYVFTVGFGGLYYSIVDMNLNGNLGAVTQKNIPLIPRPNMGKLSAVHHADGQSIWVMSTRKNVDNEFTSFTAVKVNTDGTIEDTVVSDGLAFRAVTEGVLVFSPNGERMACSNYLPASLTDHILIFDFDNQTGVVSNRRNLLTSLTFFEVISANGLAFTRDSEYLYATLIKQGFLNVAEGTVSVPEGYNTSNLIYEYDLNILSPQEYYTLHYEQFREGFPGALQLAKNGKIYRALPKNTDEGTNFLGTAYNPDISTVSSTYDHNSIDLSPDNVRLGLPNFIQSHLRTRILTENICLNEELPFEVDTYATITAAQWDFGDGTTSNEIAPTHVFTDSGIYDVSVTITVNNRPISTTKKIEVYALPELLPDLELINCDTDTDGISVFNLFNIRESITNPDLQEQLIFYETLNDAEQDTNPIDNPINYTNTTVNQEVFVRAINENECYSISSFFLNTVFVELTNIPDFYTCENSDDIVGDGNGTFDLDNISNTIRIAQGFPSSTTLDYYLNLEDALTSQNSINPSYTTSSTTLWVRAESVDVECSGVGPVNLIVNDTPVIGIDDFYTFCRSEGFTLLGDTSNDSFEWLNSEGEVVSTLQELFTDTEGTYTLIVYKTQNGIECSNSKSFTITQVAAPEFLNIETDLDYNNNTITITMEGDGSYEFSLNNINYFGNSNQYTFYNVESGIQTIYARDTDQCNPEISQTLYLIGYPKFLTPNDDGVNDYWQIKGLVENTYKSIRIFDRYGKLITELNPSNGLRWDGRFNNVIMPSNDYWFRVEFLDGNVTVGHFSLKN
ncbi:T9SS type B sorting domain-containing protein [uncultured Winogradskyella sp.]|uniref:T9SS type B sorting domain-containing protein n=1 Tax=uncultured Winogradskyella sp. TaxID=395353 RepID=UPI00260454B2|nr:T9SS type B sorting domain-containing protein [uncultured Winogradskyella sp.]